MGGHGSSTKRLTSYWADDLKRQFEGRALPGDEDNGAMSSRYCFLDLGFFPFAGQDVYYLHGGRLPQVSFQLHSGKKFTVISRNAGADNIFAQSATLNGKPPNVPVLHHADILAGGTLESIMGRQPSAWD